MPRLEPPVPAWLARLHGDALEEKSRAHRFAAGRIRSRDPTDAPPMQTRMSHLSARSISAQ